MNLKDIVTARDAAQRLSEKRLASYQKAREVAQLRKAIETEHSFYTQEESKLIEVYAERGEDGAPVFIDGGRFRLKDKTAAVEYAEEIKKLQNTEITPIAPVTLCEADFRTPDDFPTAAEMIALESFVIFE